MTAPRIYPSLLACLFATLVLVMTACRPQAEPLKPPSPPQDAAQVDISESAPAVASAAGAGAIHPELWPAQASPLPRDPEQEARIAGLMARMTLEEKVGQVLQADIASVTPEDVREYHLGSVLNGGGSAPKNDLRGRPQDWLELADAFWDASVDTSDGGVGVPVIWGTDAVHGHSNVVGATVFPHNIGLGAAADPDLLYEIGRVTALEIAVTGLDWTFAPTLAVVRNDRWGRTYEGYSEDPRIVAAYAPRLVEGLQGRLGTDEFFAPGRVIACAKHFVGDGGTVGGDDQGDNRATEAQLRDIHAAGYPPAIAAGAQTVMASFNSFHGAKMHGSKPMLTDVLVGRMGFDGFVVGDWNGHGQVAGCSPDSCAASFNAGLDMFMVPNDWKALYHNTLRQVRDGAISEARLDEAVARILRVKLRAGILDAPRPSQRAFAGRWELLAAPEHRALAREAVRKSLVLLKNDDGLLPLSPRSRILVAGDGAHDIGKQSGGWTLSWQGTGNDNLHFPNGESVFEGIRAAVEAAGGEAVLSEDGAWTERPDVAVVVFGEEPYAEGVGDRANVDYAPEDGLQLLLAFRAQNIPTVAVFLSGRPLWVNPELNAATAFVAAWLPGSEGGGVADVLIAGPDGAPRHDFSGRLSFSWPASPTQAEVNVGDPDYDPLFAYGYGLDYADQTILEELPEDGAAEAPREQQLLYFGDAVAPWALVLRDAGGEATAGDSRGRSPNGQVEAAPADSAVQEDTTIVTWNGPGAVLLRGVETDFAPEAAAGLVLELRYRVLAAPGGAADLAMTGAGATSTPLDLAALFEDQAGGDWQSLHIPLACFAEAGAWLHEVTEPLVLSAGTGLSLQLAEARVGPGPANAACTPRPDR